MQSAKQKAADAGAVAKEHVEILRAKAQEKVCIVTLSKAKKQKKSMFVDGICIYIYIYI